MKNKLKSAASLPCLLRDLYKNCKMRKRLVKCCVCGFVRNPQFAILMVSIAYFGYENHLLIHEFKYLEIIIFCEPCN